VTDAHSRYILALTIMPERSQPVREAVDALFAEYGLPHAMRSDNGTPFASIGAAGLSKLSVHWAKLGIRLERITPGQPQQNGRHERMHATLTAETARPAAGNAAAQQARFDRFWDEFNHDRPHEALGQQMPADHYKRPPRRSRLLPTAPRSAP
jgi:transposase InsO family protein